ncbi:hypothetical protein PILCRDRAFT_2830 [Piloderma croceum F 1598]|uniref:Uncharacterized protein n=1 Tax=Piloderma croceum (strain F 1598) TaxID=765440 RepID=A0A0C3CFX7_PILCF|nr:hypothetical protein PILCRDRAFT_2830 [Piloderma croceum F 1598]
MTRNQLLGWLLFSLLSCVAGYEVPVSDTDYSRQICSGMWSSQSTFINGTVLLELASDRSVVVLMQASVTFEPSQGQLAMVIYEWNDVKYLGKITSTTDDTLPKTYVCTTSAVQGGFCSQVELGRFILDLPEGKSVNETSFWSARVAFPAEGNTVTSTGSQRDGGGNPFPPPPPKNGSSLPNIVRRATALNPTIVPVTVLSPAPRQASTDVPSHPTYKGKVLFQNTFDGKLPATDYPKVTFYLCMFLAYVVIGCAWGWYCYRNINDLLPIQYYLSSLVGFLIIEMVASWAYYRYLNAHGKSTTSTVFLFVVAILDAGRNALSFFMLLVVSLGLSVVRESLGRTMLRCQLLAGAHFLFGVLYAVGIVELELESTSAFVLLIFIIPLAFTLSGFLLWILYSLNATIAQLRARKQRYKLAMFTKLYRILLLTVVIIFIFFVISTLSFSDRLAEDYAAKSWRVRWWLLDGYLALLYLVAFSAIAYLWRPTPNNRRLAMFDEIAQDEEDAEDYDLEALEHRTQARDDDDDATLVGRRGPDSLAEDHVVFEIGDEDAGSDEDDDSHKKRRSGQKGTTEHRQREDDERTGLIGEDRND